MVARRTRQILLKLRHIEELEARRGLGEAERAVVRASVAVTAVVARAEVARAKLGAATAKPAGGMRAGALAQRENYLVGLRKEVDDLLEQRRVAEQILADAEVRAGKAQETLAAALLALEASAREERHAAEVEARVRDRRLERQAQDRWRPRRDS